MLKMRYLLPTNYLRFTIKSETTWLGAKSNVLCQPSRVEHDKETDDVTL